MTFSPEQWATIRDKAAEIVAAEAMKEAGGAKGLVVFPIATVTQMTGLSRHTIPKRMAVTETSPGKFGVTLRNLEAYLDGKTMQPTSEKRKAEAGTSTLQS